MANASEKSRGRFGRLLKLVRERAGLSQRQLAAQIGVSGPYVARCEGGQTVPSNERIVVLASTLGLPSPLPLLIAAVDSRVWLVEEHEAAALAPWVAGASGASVMQASV